MNHGVLAPVAAPFQMADASAATGLNSSHMCTRS